MKKLRIIIAVILIFITAQAQVLAAPRIPVYKVGNVLYFLDKSSGTITGFAGEPTDVIIPLSLGGYSVVSIGPRAFAGSTTLRTLSIPDGITTISAEAFASCPNLTSVAIGSTVSYIGSSAFANCQNLAQVAFLGFLENIEADAFNNTLWITGSTSEYVMLGGTTLIKYNGAKESVTVPYGVKNIAANAFAYNPYVKEIILPETVRKIGDNAFIHCTSLSNIVIPTTVSHIGAGAFDDTLWMSGFDGDFVTVNGILISYKGDDKHVELPEGITAIGSGAFMANTNLFSVHIPESIVYIDSMAFGGCSSLNLLNIPAGVEWIDEYAFAGCVRLTLHTSKYTYGESYAQYMEMPYSSEVYVTYNGNRVYFDSVAPIIYYERTFLPLRAIMEMMGFTVSWDSATGNITCTKGSRIITITPAGEITINGELYPATAPPLNRNGSSLMSVRVIAEAAQAQVVWNDATRTVEITY